MHVATLQVFFNIVFELLSGMTLISFASSELTIKQMMRYAVTVHSNDMSHPAKLSLKQNSFDAGGVGMLQGFQIGDTVFPANSEDGAEAHMWNFSSCFFSIFQVCGKVSKFHTYI